MERITRLFNYEEETDRNQIDAAIGSMPSPQNQTYHHYIQHRLKMSRNGIETYTQRSVARLRLDKHIECHRAIDRIANKLVCHKSALIYIGAGGSTPANSPISIKKYVRCPGTRKLLNALKKRGNCIIKMVDEYMTSQHCARCFKQFPRWTKPKRYKLCDNCQPNERVHLPQMIVTNVSKRVLKMKRTIERTWKEMVNDGDAIAAILTQRNTKRLVSKKQRFWKNWLQPNVAVNAETENAAQSPKNLKTVWQRDISAAKLILYKGNNLIDLTKLFNLEKNQLLLFKMCISFSSIGRCQLFGLEIHPALIRPRRDQNYIAPP